MFIDRVFIFSRISSKQAVLELPSESQAAKTLIQTKVVCSYKPAYGMFHGHFSALARTCTCIDLYIMYMYSKLSKTVVLGYIVGLSVTREGNLLFIDEKTDSILVFTMTAQNYKFSYTTKFGQDTLNSPCACVQMSDGRVAVTDGKTGHSIKV